MVYYFRFGSTGVEAWTLKGQLMEKFSEIEIEKSNLPNILDGPRKQKRNTGKNAQKIGNRVYGKKMETNPDSSNIFVTFLQRGL